LFEKSILFMKIAKLMLMSVAIFAVVGGALAFKAKTFSSKFCVGTADGVNTFVPTYSAAHKFTIDTEAPSLIYRTSDALGDPIDAAADCVNLTTTTTSSTRITNE
jgi:hypothetical protein